MSTKNERHLKHIQKRFLHEEKLSPVVDAVLQEAGASMDLSPENIKNVKIPKGYQPFVVTDALKKIGCFAHRINGVKCIIPEPDPVLMCINSAYLNLTQIEKSKEAIINKLNGEIMSESVINDLYTYYYYASGVIMFLYTALEAFMNRVIPNGYEYFEKDARKTTIYDKQQVIRFLSNEKKINEILPAVFGKNFMKTHPLQETRINNLKSFRNELIHISEKKEGESPYDYLYKKALNFSFKESYLAVIDFMNYYKSDFVLMCPCSSEW